MEDDHILRLINEYGSSQKYIIKRRPLQAEKFFKHSNF